MACVDKISSRAHEKTSCEIFETVHGTHVMIGYLEQSRATVLKSCLDNP